MKKVHIAILAAVIIFVASAGSLILFVGGDDDETAPSAPTDLMLVPGEGEVTISWGEPTSSGSEDVTSYKVYLFDDQGAEMEMRSTSGTSLLWTGLEGETEYSFQVSAVNDAGEGAKAGPVSTTTLKIVIVPNAAGMLLSVPEIGEEYELDSLETTKPTDLLPLGLRNYALAEFMVDLPNPLVNWRFVTIEICVCATPEEATALYAFNFERSYISTEPADYDDIGIGEDSRFYTLYTTDGIVLDGWFINGSIVVHMEFDSSDYEPVVTGTWFKSLISEQSEKIETMVQQ